MTKNKYLIVICGPTASGKTGLGIELAKYYNTVIISADSRQFYRELAIGTAKPTKEECEQIPHYFVDSLSIEDDYSVGQFERDTLVLLDDLYKKHDVVVLVGGSGLYIKAICEGLDEYPEIPPSIRQNLMQCYEQEGIETLQEELKTVDLEYYQRVDLQNPHRLIRALEVYRASGKSFSSYQRKNKANRSFLPLKIALDWDREVLYQRINQRVDNMLAAGLEEEVRAVYPRKHLNALQTIGYKEFFDHFDGKFDREEAIRLIKRNTRRFAKRQLTWFRKESDIKQCSPNAIETIFDYLNARMKASTE